MIECSYRIINRNFFLGSVETLTWEGLTTKGLVVGERLLATALIVSNLDANKELQELFLSKLKIWDVFIGLFIFELPPPVPELVPPVPDVPGVPGAPPGTPPFMFGSLFLFFLFLLLASPEKGKKE